MAHAFAVRCQGLEEPKATHYRSQQRLNYYLAALM